MSTAEGAGIRVQQLFLTAELTQWLLVNTQGKNQELFNWNMGTDADACGSGEDSCWDALICTGIPDLESQTPSRFQLCARALLRVQVTALSVQVSEARVTDLD